MIREKNYLCYECVKKAGFNPLTWMGNLKTDKEEILNRISGKEAGSDKNLADQTIKESSKKLSVSKNVGNIFMVDEDNKLWTCQDPFGLNKASAHRFEEILSFELLEDGEQIIKGGVGSAVAGGLAFGALGAVVGATTGKKKLKSTCSKMRIKITLNDIQHPVEYVNILQMKVSKNSAAYKKATKQANEILSLLEVMVQQKNVVTDSPMTSGSTADEILKYKNLMDQGIITEEEFSQKKKQLLGI
ncbi:MAG: SHOCT domain-containing protein [Lachnospiraceae bacterium]|nr:SHOCT domain-containing protein [Lachnospiraceae bacterium]